MSAQPEEFTILWRKVDERGPFGDWRCMPVPMVCLEDANLRGWYQIEYARVVPIPREST